MKKISNYFVDLHLSDMPNKLIVISFISCFVYGCAGRHAVVAVSGTVIGVEISQNPANQSPQAKLGYNRGEFAIVPTNRSATEEPGTSSGGAKDIADVILEIRYGGIFDTGPSSGIYQRLAVGPTAVAQPGASLMFARDANGELPDKAADALKSLQSVREPEQKVSEQQLALGKVFRNLKDEDKRKFDDAARTTNVFKDFSAFLIDQPRQPTPAEVQLVRKTLEAQGFKF